MKYGKEILVRCRQWVEVNGLSQPMGGTVSMLCEEVGISEVTFYDWKKKKPYFSKTIKNAQKMFAHTIAKEVSESLAKRAKGYRYTEIKTEKVANAAGKPVISKMVTTEKEVAPDTGAAIFLLTNIDGENWKNKQVNDVTSGGEPLQVIVSGEKVKRDLDKLGEIIDGKKE